MVKLGQMDQATFQALRDEIVGGDVKDVHLVKGLDYKLLERVRKGEDVLAAKTKPEDSPPKEPEAGPEIDVDDEFEKLEQQDIAPLAKEEKSKKGEMAPLSVAGKKRTRDDILKELKASRMTAAAEAKAHRPALGARFKRFGDRREPSRIERDERGREVMIMVDADGNVKRKVKKLKVEENGINGLLMPDKEIAPLGMEVAAVAPPPELQEDDGDIFEGVGTDFNPLGDAEVDDDDDSDESEEEKSLSEGPQDTIETPPPPSSNGDMSNVPSHPVPLSSRPRNYFNDASDDGEATNKNTQNPLTDPTILAALKKASSIAPISSSTDPINKEEAAKLLRRKKMLESHDRDADDMDMGFGSSRFGDEEDAEEGKKVKLSVWGSGGGGDDGGGGKEKRKRGPTKKKKGEVNSAADVLKVLEGRKEGRK